MNNQSNDMNELLEATNAVDPGLIAEQLLNEIEQGVALDQNDQNDMDALVDIEPINLEAGKDDDGDLGIDRSSLYEEQDAKLSVGTAEQQAPIEGQAGQVEHASDEGADAKVETQKSATRAKKPAPQPKGTPGADATATTPSGMLKKQADVTGLKQLGFDDEGVDALMNTIDGAPKKVAEKAKNLLRYALGREHVSAVTKFALSKLRDTPAGFTTVDLVAMLQAERSYSAGTARSQAQQMSRLFSMFDMVGKDGKVMTLQGDNALSKAVLSRLQGDPFIAEPVTGGVEESEEEQVPGGVEATADPEGDGGTTCAEPEAEAPSPAPLTVAAQASTRRNRKKNQRQQKLAA